MADFADIVVKERERLIGLMVDHDMKLKALELEGNGIRREIAALDAYEAAKSGKATVAVPRSGRGARTETILSLIAGKPSGMTRAAILEDLGVKGDKSQEGSISNALTTMKKNGRLHLTGGVYTAA